MLDQYHQMAMDVRQIPMEQRDRMIQECLDSHKGEVISTDTPDQALTDEEKLTACSTLYVRKKIMDFIYGGKGE